MKNLYLSVVLLLLLLGPVVVRAQEERSLGPVSRTYAITRATIIQGPGRKIEQGTVVVTDGLISAVGKNVTVPPDATVIKGDSLYVYAGFIDGLSRTGVVKPKEEGSRERAKDPGNPTPERAGITPQTDVRYTLNPEERSIEELRGLGFTAAQVVPYGGMLPGNSAIILLGATKTSDPMVLVSKSAFYSELATAERVYPNTVIGVMAKWRELYRQASLAKGYESTYASNRSGLGRPESNRTLEAFYPVIDKRQPVLFKAEKYLDAQRVLALQADLGFSLILGDLKEGWDAIPKIKTAGAKVFLSLDLPEEKKDDKKDEKGKKDEKAKSEEKKADDKSKTATPEEIAALEKRKAEFIALYEGQAAAFQKAGVTFGFSALSAKTKDIPANLRRMIKAGLTEDQALAALTTGPAQLLGVSDRLGSVDPGKMGNLVISDKPYFNEKAKVRYVFVDGVPFKQEVSDKPKGDANAKVLLEGTWIAVTDIPQGKNEEKVTFKKDATGYTGSVSGTMVPQPISLLSVSLDGTSLKYTYTVQVQGQPVTVEVEATVEGDTYKGTATAGSFGSFPVEAKRDPNR